MADSKSELEILVKVIEDEKAKWWRETADKTVTINVKADKKFTDLMRGGTSDNNDNSPSDVGADSATERDLNTRFQRSTIEFQRVSIPLLRTGAGVARGAVSGLSQLGMGGGLARISQTR